jgi:flagellar biosynthesis GTPase FlhF
MRVKKFEAKSMKEALHMVKQELGPDAVILSARDNRKSFGIGGQASVEITAAVSESTLQKKKFAESRLPQAQRDQFAAAGARQQRLMIEKMVEKRVRRNEEEQQAAVRKPITKMSYIDIPDDVQESPRRSNAFAKAAGRSVDDLLLDFDQDLMSPEEFAQAELVARAKAARQQGARSNVRNAALAARAHIAAEQAPLQRASGFGSGDETGGGIAEGALARIRNAARDAWKNNPFAEEAPARPAAPVRPAARLQAAPPMRAASAQGTQSTSTAGYSRATTVQAAAAAASQRPPAQTTSANMNTHGSASRGRGGLELVEDYDQFQQVQITNAQAPTAESAQPYEVAKLHGEIARLEKMLEGFHKVPQTFATLHPGADYGISYDFSFMYQKLSEAGIATDLIVEILKAAEKEIDPLQAKKKPIIDAWVARWFLTNTKTIPTSPTTAGRLHLFVGGTGSGKTTSLIKMAAQLVVKEKKTVAILSTDSTKVGAVDQMKIYCQILNVPFAVIRNKQDWEWVFSQLRNIDHILVDFPGTQLREIEEIHHLKSLLPPEGYAPITHLCVSATSKDGDADELARRYKVAEPNDLIFTNLDQSVQHGIIYNLQRRTGLMLHSFGIGNRIPEDFEAASKERVLDLIFKLTKLRRETT